MPAPSVSGNLTPVALWANGKEAVMKAAEWQPFIAESNDVPHGVIKGAQDRFWSALGDHAGAVAHRINTEPGYLHLLARTAVKHHMRALSAQAVAEAKQKHLGTYKVADCFLKPLFYERDGSLDFWLPATLERLPVNNLKHTFTGEKQKFCEMAQVILATYGKDDSELMKLMVKRQKCLDLLQVQEISKGFEINDVGFFFVDGGNGIAVVVLVYRNFSGCGVRIYRFDDHARWDCGIRTYFRN